jgi:predicted transposase YbfD/YdcC
MLAFIVSYKMCYQSIHVSLNAKNWKPSKISHCCETKYTYNEKKSSGKKQCHVQNSKKFRDIEMNKNLFI